MRNIKIPVLGAIALLAALFYLPFLGLTHLFDWDEINFAESAREMLVSGEYTFVQINYVPFWEKPPLFIWMQALSMQLFGVSEFAARLPNALCGILTLLLLYRIGKREKDANFGLLWTLSYGCSMLPFLYFKAGIIDPWFNLFIFLGIYYGYRYLIDTSQKIPNVLLVGLFTGLSMLTKGPVGPLLVGLSLGIFFFFNLKRRKEIKVSHIFLGLIGFILVGGFWFLIQIFTGKWEVIVDFVVYQIRLFQTQDAGHGGFLGYHAVVLLVGVFPASIFALGELFGARKSDKIAALHLLMKIAFWVVLILFSIVRTKIVHYSSMAYFPLAFLAAFHLHELWQKEKGPRGWQLLLLGLIGLILSLAVGSLAFAPALQEGLREASWLRDPFAKGNLQADAGWRGYEWFPGLLLLLGLCLAFWQVRKRIRLFTYLIFASTALFTFLSVLWIVPRAERISQRAAIEFFESKAGEDCYLATLNYKSYAHYFYGRVKAGQRREARDKTWLRSGPIDKPAYFSTKIQFKEQVLQRSPELELLYTKNGFAFFVRHPRQSP